MTRRSPLVLSAALLGGILGCNALTETQSAGTPVMIVLLNARAKAGGFTTNPVTNFYRVGSAAFSSALSATDSCRGAAYDPTAVSTPQTASSIGGGAYVAVRISGRSDTLRKVSATNFTYTLASAAGLVFTPGDSMIFVVPGDNAGFPGTTLIGRTAEPFTFNPIVVPPQGQTMGLSWTTATDGDAAMLVSLRYNSGSGTGLNAQIFCDFRDDGSGVVQAPLAALWANSSTREVYVSRLRTALLQVSGLATNSYFNMISTFEIPTPVSP